MSQTYWQIYPQFLNVDQKSTASESWSSGRLDKCASTDDTGNITEDLIPLVLAANHESMLFERRAGNIMLLVPPPLG